MLLASGISGGEAVEKAGALVENKSIAEKLPAAKAQRAPRTVSSQLRKHIKYPARA